MTKKFMYACFGILALVVAFHLGATLGQATMTLQTSDIAVGGGYIQHGQTIPLPYYEDGTQAIEDDCVWMLAPIEVGMDASWAIEEFSCHDFDPPNRLVEFSYISSTEEFYDGYARYLIIAVKNSGSWCAGVKVRKQGTTWGKVKAEFEE